MRLKLIIVCATAALAAALLPAAVSGRLPRAPVLVASKMNGNKELHGPTDPDARGRAVLEVRRRRNRICYFVEFRNIGTPPESEDEPDPLPTAAHVHRGRKRQVGPIVLTLFDTPSPSPVEGCVRHVPLDLMNEMVTRPPRFYVNLHTEQYPEGEIRAQLHHPKD